MKATKEQTELAEVQARLAWWRGRYGGRGRPIPEELWTAATAVADTVVLGEPKRSRAKRGPGGGALANTDRSWGLRRGVGGGLDTGARGGDGRGVAGAARLAPFARAGSLERRRIAGAVAEYCVYSTHWQTQRVSLHAALEVAKRALMRAEDFIEQQWTQQRGAAESASTWIASARSLMGGLQRSRAGAGRCCRRVGRGDTPCVDARRVGGETTPGRRAECWMPQANECMAFRCSRTCCSQQP